MKQYGVFYDGKSQAGAPHLARTAFVDTIETFEQMGQVLLSHSHSVVGKRDAVLILRLLEQ